MLRDLTKIPHKLDPKDGSCRAIVETPKGRRGKLDYDPKTDTFRLKTLLPDGMSFPLDFGFVPPLWPMTAIRWTSWFWRTSPTQVGPCSTSG